VNKHNPPAFPTNGHHEEGPFVIAGMTLRDYFAAKAMQAMVLPFMESHCAGGDEEKYLSNAAKIFRACAASTATDSDVELADLSYFIADAMLEARKSD
jgi:hypothetical protein